jgi:copper chaperone
MFESESRTQLLLAPSSAGCSCCSSEPLSPPAFTGAIEFSLEGLTCGHCAQTVEKAVSALEGVESATIELVPGGRSRLLVAGKAAGNAVRQAVLSAGYMAIGN